MRGSFQNNRQRPNNSNTSRDDRDQLQTRPKKRVEVNSDANAIKRSLVVSNLHENVHNEELNEMFSTVGKLIKCGIQ